MTRRENQELATKQDITTHLTEEEATEIYIDQKRTKKKQFGAKETSLVPNEEYNAHAISGSGPPWDKGCKT